MFSVENCGFIGYNNSLEAVCSVCTQTFSCACSGSPLTFVRSMSCSFPQSMRWKTHPCSVHHGPAETWVAFVGGWLSESWCSLPAFHLWALLKPLVTVWTWLPQSCSGTTGRHLCHVPLTMHAEICTCRLVWWNRVLKWQRNCYWNPALLSVPAIPSVTSNSAEGRNEACVYSHAGEVGENQNMVFRSRNLAVCGVIKTNNKPPQTNRKKKQTKNPS